MHALHYKIVFKNRQNDTVTINILEKDYINTAVTELTGGDNPLVFDYQMDEDEIFKPIRSSSAKIQYLNNGAHPVTTFAADDEDKFKIEVYINGALGNFLYWSGFIVQDDCREDFLPAPNLVTLEATDNLGLLKGITIKDALEARGVDIYSKTRFLDAFNACLKQTGLELALNTFCNVFENGMDDRSVNPVNDPFGQSKINSKSWIKGKREYNSCYEVLEEILAAWKCTLFQAKGEWFIVRWPELKRYNNAIPGTRYEFDLVNPTAISFDAIKNFGRDEMIHAVNANQIKSIVRSNKYTKLTYNYKQPYKLILNDDLLDLGAFISTATIGDYRYDRYELVDIDKINGQDAYIEVVTYLVTGDESDRYLVMKKNGSTSAAIQLSDVEVNEGDKFNFNFSFKTTADVSGSGDIVFVAFRLYINATDYYALKWSSGSSYQQNTFFWDGPYSTVQDFANEPSIGRGGADDLTEWARYGFSYHAPTAISARFPADGILKIFVYGYNLAFPVTSITTDLHLKDFAIDLKAFINDSTQIIGQVHKAEQQGVKKQNYEEEIYIDDAPKNSIKGVMFLNDETTKTTLWHRGGVSESVKFGHIQKTDLLFLTDAFRTRIEGDFLGLKDNSSYLFTLYNVFAHDFLTDKYFIFGNCNFNMKTCEFNGVLEEAWNTTEVQDETLYTNTFNYIYDKQ